MKKLGLLSLLGLFLLASCSSTETVGIGNVPKTPTTEVQEIGGGVYVYNCYTDGTSIILADSTSYVEIEKTQYGIRFNATNAKVMAYKDEEYVLLESNGASYKNGDTGFTTSFKKVRITVKALEDKNVNIGTITQWS